jgi:predicted GNAT family acetyltransferase
VFELYELLDIVESASAIYGLDEDRRRGLGQAILARLCRNVLAS